MQASGGSPAALAPRGHDVTAVEKDPDLVARSRRLFPEVPVVEADILELSPALLSEQGRPTSYDVIVVVGNVMIYLAEDTETRALRTLGDLLAPEGGSWWASTRRRAQSTAATTRVEDFRRPRRRRPGWPYEHEFGSYDLQARR